MKICSIQPIMRLLSAELLFKKAYVFSLFIIEAFSFVRGAD